MACVIIYTLPTWCPSDRMSECARKKAVSTLWLTQPHVPFPLTGRKTNRNGSKSNMSRADCMSNCILTPPQITGLLQAATHCHTWSETYWRVNSADKLSSATRLRESVKTQSKILRLSKTTGADIYGKYHLAPFGTLLTPKPYRSERQATHIKARFSTGTCYFTALLTNQPVWSCLRASHTRGTKWSWRQRNILMTHFHTYL